MYFRKKIVVAKCCCLQTTPVAQFQIYQFIPLFPSNVTWLLRFSARRRKNTIKKGKLNVLFHLRNRLLSIKLIVHVYPFTTKEPAITIKGMNGARNGVFESNARPLPVKRRPRLNFPARVSTNDANIHLE